MNKLPGNRVIKKIEIHRIFNPINLKTVSL